MLYVSKAPGFKLEGGRCDSVRAEFAESFYVKRSFLLYGLVHTMYLQTYQHIMSLLLLRTVHLGWFHLILTQTETHSRGAGPVTKSVNLHSFKSSGAHGSTADLSFKVDTRDKCHTKSIPH